MKSSRSECRPRAARISTSQWSFGSDLRTISFSMLRQRSRKSLAILYTSPLTLPRKIRSLLSITHSNGTSLNSLTTTISLHGWTLQAWNLVKSYTNMTWMTKNQLSSRIIPNHLIKYGTPTTRLSFILRSGRTEQSLWECLKLKSRLYLLQSATQPISMPTRSLLWT